MKNYDRLLRYMLERHNIYLRRKAGQPKPWTQDAILQAYRFCNVYRELDTVTQWIAREIRDAFPEHRHLWFMLCVARHFNLPSTLNALMKAGAWPGVKWNPVKAALALQRVEGPTYTGAYMINPPTKAELAAVPAHIRTKVGWSCVSVLGALWEDRNKLGPAFEVAKTLRDAHQLLLPYRGWAGFMAYEVISDLRWTGYLKHASDIRTWAHMGPGALRGLQRLYGRPIEHRPPQDLALREAMELRLMLWADWPRGKAWPALEMREIEHSLCEFDKYERVRLGEGRPRQTYNGLA